MLHVKSCRESILSQIDKENKWILFSSYLHARVDSQFKGTLAASRKRVFFNILE
jgi:hypothetical protein